MTPAALYHRLNVGFCYVEHGVQVGPQYRVPIGFIKFAKGSVSGDACIVHEDTDFPAVRVNLLCQLPQLGSTALPTV